MLERDEYYQKIRDYYRESNWLYKYIWYQGNSLGLHFGFADKSTKSHTEALINQYKYVIEKAQIKPGMMVLDAGCGVGGAAIYIAKNTGAHVVGITLVPEQADEATHNADKFGVKSNTEFIVGDYTKTKLKSGTFDVVFGMESVCYAELKAAFLKEAYRLLKPGGKLVLTDGYRLREIKGGHEVHAFQNFCEGWRLQNLITYKEMTAEIVAAGFIRVEIEDKTKNIEMSLTKMRRLVKLQHLGELILGWIKLPIVEMTRLNEKAMTGWIYGVEVGLFGYYGHVARKPAK